MAFTHHLLTWYATYGRDLPWRHTTDPYILWLSEVILQQTRVEQGRPYFECFVKHFPNVRSFADAPEDAILRLWQGLGYYSRARNMHKAAQKVMEDFEGIFPTSYSELLQLPGIGTYTASAISSFSADEVRAVVDGNVYRVLARVFGIDNPINTTTSQKLFQELANDLIDKQAPGRYNQAIMDFGAIQCTPKQPACTQCPVQGECIAFETNRVEQLPVKIKSKKSRSRYFHYFLITKGNQVMVSKRGTGDVWANLYEFPLLETSEPLSMDQLMAHDDYQRHFGQLVPVPVGPSIRHILSHQNIHAQFYHLPENSDLCDQKSTWHYTLSENLDKLAKHKLIFSFLKKNGLPA